jgi:hypothetical protein
MWSHPPVLKQKADRLPTTYVRSSEVKLSFRGCNFYRLAPITEILPCLFGDNSPQICGLLTLEDYERSQNRERGTWTRHAP